MEIGNSDIFVKKNSGGLPMVAIEKQVLVYLWYSG